MERIHLSDDDADYVAIYSACALWALLFAVFTPSVLDDPMLRVVNGALMFVAGSSSLSCLYGVLTHDRLGPERLALWGVMAGFVVYAITQLVLAVVYLAAGNTDRIALVVLALLPVLFLNRRRRFLVKRRRAVTVVRQMHESKERGE